MVIFELFWVFIKIGFTSFGGMSMVPVINQEMLSHGWMTQEDVANILAIAEMTPGPLGLNCATFAGIQVAGILGGLLAVAGVLMPAFTTTLLVAAFYEKFKKTKVMAQILYVIRPICIGLIISIIITLVPDTYIENTYFSSISNILIGIMAFILLKKYKKSVPIVILISAVMGLMLNLLNTCI